MRQRARNRTRGGTRGREHTFEELYRKSYDRVYSYVRLRMGNSPDVEDVVSESFLKAARAFDRYDPERARFSTWVIQIAINTIIDHRRRARPIVDLDAVPESLVSAPEETDAVADRELVGQLLSVLTPEEADAVLMKYRDGKRNVEIAAELGINPSTVSSRLFNALRKMRKASEGK